ncbi:MAG: hypothetical protein R2810_04115 [Flavobacteriales bacterium]
MGELIDCEGTAGGTALPGTTCDDGLSTTGNDTWDANCNCVGQLIDCEGTAGGTALPGTTCDDGLSTTGNDTWDANGGSALCGPADRLRIAPPVALPSRAPPATMDLSTSGNETWDAELQLRGPADRLRRHDCLGVPGGSALPGHRLRRRPEHHG